MLVAGMLVIAAALFTFVVAAWILRIAIYLLMLPRVRARLLLPARSSRTREGECP